MERTTTKLGPDNAVVLAIASAAIFYNICPDGKAGYSKSPVEDPDCRWPAENAARAVGISELEDIAQERKNEPLDAHTVFEHALEMGLLLGARIGANPSRVPDTSDLIKRCRAAIEESLEPIRGAA
jgi:hypothetical protein